MRTEHNTGGLVPKRFPVPASLLWLACASMFISTKPAPAQTTETVLHNFAYRPNGASPYAGVILDAAGNFYGTTTYGGTSNAGVVYKVDTTGAETVLHTFTGGTDGGQPQAGVIRDSAGNLYGTTYAGGIAATCGGSLSIAGCGVVYKLDAGGKEKVLYTFTGGADGGLPYAGLIRDPAGNFYGTTSAGGPANAGVVFELDTAGNYTVLHGFTGGADGGVPMAGVIRDSAGNLYGTTANGGTGAVGVVFKLDTTGHETVLYTFGTNGYYPLSGVVRDSAGNLYGTTYYGGQRFLAGIVYNV